MRLVHDPNEILWYAMSSPFRREMKAKALLDAHHIEYFIPMKKRQEIREGKIVMWEEPAVHNLVFVHDSYNGIMKVKKGLDILQFILNPLSPIVVPRRQMDDFIRFYESGGYDEPEFLSPQMMGKLRKNARVVIVDGPLAGIEGYYQRVKGAKDKRFIVLIEGLVAMACCVECKFVKEK